MPIMVKNSRNICLGENRYQLQCFLNPVQMKVNGDWIDIDSSIEEADTEGFSRRFIRVPYLARIAEDSRRRIYPDRDNPDCWIEFGKPFVNMGLPSRKDRWFYWDFPKATLGIRFDNTSILLGFKLKDSSTPTSITIPFETQNLHRKGRFLYSDAKIVGKLVKPMACGSNFVDDDQVRKLCSVSFGAGAVTISLDPSGLEYPIDIYSIIQLYWEL